MEGLNTLSCNKYPEPHKKSALTRSSPGRAACHGRKRGSLAALMGQDASCPPICQLPLRAQAFPLEGNWSDKATDTTMLPTLSLHQRERYNTNATNQEARQREFSM